MTMSVSQAKNAIKRCLWDIVNPPPKNFSEMWDHFENKCAYCEKELDRNGRQGHKDHLVAFQDSSRKGIGNFVLACGTCNGDKKRELEWLDYLRAECGQHERFEWRKSQIEKWIAKHAGEKTTLPPDVVTSVSESIATVFESLDKVVAKLRGKATQEKLDEFEDFELSEEESARIDRMIEQADAEIFARRKKVRVEFDWDDFSVDVVEKAAAIEGLSFEEFLKRKAYYSALKDSQHSSFDIKSTARE